MLLSIVNKQGVHAIAEYDPTTKTTIVKKGSTVSPSVRTSGKFHSANAIVKLRELHCKDSKTIEDVVFRSASTAANFVTGQSTNGLKAWKDEDGHSLKEILLSE